MERRGASVYVVDDDIGVREALVGYARSMGLDSVGFASARDFLAYPRRDEACCLVLDVDMPQETGLELQRRLNAANDDVPIIFITGHGDVPMTVDALKAGAVDFLTKPIDERALDVAIREALALSNRRKRPRAAQKSRDTTRTTEGIVGQSSLLREVLWQIEMVASADTTVLILGETGTGKERLARAVHDQSHRAAGPFVKVNCAAIPHALLESELMGHERGAFTGALAQRIGRFESASEGTIFLDEIGELPLELQPKLLRLLQEQEFERVGGSHTVASNARVVAATNRNLEEMVRDLRFREDLYYRLSVFPIRVPPLRERREDIPSLAQHFADKFAARLGKPIAPLSDAVFEKLLDHRWPGNIRELENVMERAVLLSVDGVIEIPGRSLQSIRDVSANSESLSDVSRAHIQRVLQQTNWVIAGPHGAAARLRMKRSTLIYRIKKLGIEMPRRDRSALSLASGEPGE